VLRAMVGDPSPNGVGWDDVCAKPHSIKRALVALAARGMVDADGNLTSYGIEAGKAEVNHWHWANQTGQAPYRPEEEL